MIDWLCSTSLPTDSPRNLYSTLQRVSTELQSHAERTPGMAVSIVEARRRLAGEETSDLLSMPHNDLLEGAIVLEEFSKVSLNIFVIYKIFKFVIFFFLLQEIATVLFAKKTTSMLTLPSP